MPEAQPIGLGNPFAAFSWTSSDPIRMTFLIQGPGGFANYMPPGMALVQYVDPFSGQSVVQAFPVGGQGATRISVITGSSLGLATGEVRITVVDNTDLPIPLGGMEFSLLPGYLKALLGAAGAIDDGVTGVFGTDGYYVSEFSTELTDEFKLYTNVTYPPGFLESRGIHPGNLDQNLFEPLFDQDGNFIGVNDKANNFHCFAAGTEILLESGESAAIEAVQVDDLVLAFDPSADRGRGALVPRRVVRTFTTPDRITVDFHGLQVTPSHVFLCGDGPHEGEFRVLLDILRDDGAVVNDEGERVRAATNCPVGSAGDRFVEIAYISRRRDRRLKRSRLRAGAKLLLEDGTTTTLLDRLAAEGYRLGSDGLVAKPGEEPHPLFWFGRPPKPEDYILRASGVSLEDLYQDCGYRPVPADGPGEAVSCLRGYTPSVKPAADPLDDSGLTLRRLAGETIQ